MRPRVALGKKLSVLIEINVGGEAAKSGVAPDSRELEDLLLAAPQFEALEFRGLMTVPPFTDDPEEARPYFRKLREIARCDRRPQTPCGPHGRAFHGHVARLRSRD